MRGWLAWIVAIAAGIVLVLVVTAMIGNRDDSGETVPAGEWAQSVCGAVGVWRGEIEAIVDGHPHAPRDAAPAIEEPQSRDAAGTDGVRPPGLERSVRATETLVEGIDNAGIPDTAEGEAAATQVSDWADASLDDLERGAGLARRRRRTTARGGDRAARRRGRCDQARGR